MATSDGELLKLLLVVKNKQDDTISNKNNIYM
jgi:hypothetical protein